MAKTVQRLQEWEAADFIDEQEIQRLLQVAETATKEEVLAIIKKAHEAKGLTLPEVPALLQVADLGVECHDLIQLRPQKRRQVRRALGLRQRRQHQQHDGCQQQPFDSSLHGFSSFTGLRDP